MAISIPRGLAECILLGPMGDRRQLQDSPILGDVWIAFATAPAETQELLITPHKSKTAGLVANKIDDRVWAMRAADGSERELAGISYLQGIVAAKLKFRELLEVVVPVTSWWSNTINQREIKLYHDPKVGERRILDVLEKVEKLIAEWASPRSGETRLNDTLTSLDRYAALAGLILWAERKDTEAISDDLPGRERLVGIIRQGRGDIVEKLKDLFNRILESTPKKQTSLVYQISLNRQAGMAVSKSVPSVKADAVRRLFDVNCSGIAWAIVDAGFSEDHECFLDPADQDVTRVVASFDFSKYRKIVNLDNFRIFDPQNATSLAAKRTEVLSELVHTNLKKRVTPKSAAKLLRQLSLDMRNERPIHWELVERFIEIKPNTPATISDHGTHVAGILGANRKGRSSPTKAPPSDHADGMCPNIRLYDFRVLSESQNVKDTEFAIIAALQYIRYMNERNDYVSVHGANLSLSIPHDVRNYACGRTPICDECERLVESGVVVVAAAGNLGYHSFTTKEGAFEGYAAFSITDPGNADGVITVGSTHRYAPHTYGVSFFSSRGPTGDGRMKPDLVAPGEKIHAPVRNGWGDLDGTSMAAPHVSGAAALLMARYPELIGQPRKIKKILCESATDLGRERSFQGHGLLDVLRAFQSL